MPRHHAEGDPWVVLQLLQAPGSARVARSSLRSELTAAGLAHDLVADAQLIMGELVANAVEHGRADREGMIEVAWLLTTDRLLVRVRDSGSGARLAPGSLDIGHAGPEDRGRGLALVDRLSDAWSADTHRAGTQVTATLMRGDR
ncbi:hypothetical protein GCM10009798_39060 [Nocardioides panacihumi]|uniref:Histidine kinase/HSP90-like ATPase domain-containing protein n=1 Tax=Nocardioides panacihumi TaxID=400774 RepID=A0ABN2RSH7_9ACTN